MSNLPRYMDLMLIPGSYVMFSLQHWTLLSPPDTFTFERYFHFGSAASLFLELLVIALCSSLISYWTPSDLGSSPFSVISFCLFILFMGFLRQEYGVVCHSLLQWANFVWEEEIPIWTLKVCLFRNYGSFPSMISGFKSRFRSQNML